MRNNTRLKLLLQKYTVSFDLTDEGVFILTLTDKANNSMAQFEGESYARVLAKAYSFLLKSLKNLQ